MLHNNKDFFKSFCNSQDTVWICRGHDILFQSTRKGIAPLIEYIDTYGSSPGDIIAYDRVIGNAAALLLEKAGCMAVFSVIGSELAEKTLQSLDITYSFAHVVPYIVNRTGEGMCPFEKASIGTSSDEFFQYVKERIRFTDDSSL
jgi:hypothetical protein